MMLYVAFICSICIGYIVSFYSNVGVFIKQGHAFNTFPKMGDTWIPDNVLGMRPFMRNFFENTATVQVLKVISPFSLVVFKQI